MQTKILKDILNTPQGREANDILRSCVHCGFCLPVCPTYNLLLNETDSPRGRIYLIKNILEGEGITKKSIKHLDRCLTCRACEANCPSGVKYGYLLDIGRDLVEPKRNFYQKSIRCFLAKLLTTPAIFNTLLVHKTLFNKSYKSKKHPNKVLLIKGCVQPTLRIDINNAVIKILNKLDLEIIETKQSECCGAIEQHLSAPDAALKKVKQNIDNWHNQLQNGVEAIISTASGCGAMIKDYYSLLKDDKDYALKAKEVVAKTFDIAEFLTDKDLSKLKLKNNNISFHSPCTLQHGQRIIGVVENILEKLGAKLNKVEDSHLCCGSAGTYSILQKDIAKKLVNNKIKYLTKNNPDIIVTANIGCLMHLKKNSKIEVKHWVEVIN